MMTFKEKLQQRIEEINSMLCVGLDSDFEKLPSKFKKLGIERGIFSFNQFIIQETIFWAAAFKLNLVFYAGYGLPGLKALKMTTDYLKKNFSQIPLIADCKRSEMKRSGELAAKEIFEVFNFDALTVTPWFGFDTIEPYLYYKDKAVFVLCKDSNPSASEIQDLKIIIKGRKLKLFEYVTQLVVKKWNKFGNVFCEGPLTYPTDLLKIRKIAGDEMLILVAGYGPQGGKLSDLKEVMTQEDNLLLNASRAVIFSSSPKKTAKEICLTLKKIKKNEIKI